jgi:hypothetical protein
MSFSGENLLTEDAPLDTELAEIDMLNESKDSEEITRLQKEGVQPMTVVQDDMSYLENDPLAGENAGEDFSTGVSFEDDSAFDSTSIDLSEAVIDEPDLSAGIVENPVEEPLLDDIAIDDGLEAELPVPQDIAGEDVGAEDELAQVIPEGFEIGTEESPVPFDDDPEEAVEESAAAESAEGTAAEADTAGENLDIPSGLKTELKTVLSYMDQLLESLPEEKIEEFAKSEYFDTYKKLFKELGLV